MFGSRPRPAPELAADVAPPGHNAEPANAALLEALWRAEELTGALAAAQRDLAETRERLAAAEETIAELTEIGDAAQAAIDRLREQLARQEAESRRFAAERDAVAAELFQRGERNRAEMEVLAAELHRLAQAEKARAPFLSRRWFAARWRALTGGAGR